MRRFFFGWRKGDDGGLEENFRSYGTIDDGCSEAYGPMVGWVVKIGGLLCAGSFFLLIF